MKLHSILASTLVLFSLPHMAAAQQTSAGDNVGGICMACHATSIDGASRIGPHLVGIVGRSAAGVNGFDYSLALKAKGASGLVWTRESLDEFLRNPNDFIEGVAMAYSGESDEQTRSHIIDWLESLNSAAGSSAESDNNEDPRVEEILQISADSDYGEYLAGECVTCHVGNEASGGIPAINGLASRYTILALLGYQDGVRSNTTMQQITKSLGKEEIAALAKYFSEQ